MFFFCNVAHEHSERADFFQKKCSASLDFG